MKYAILGFRQDMLVEKNLDATDCVILAWIKDFIASTKIEMILIDEVPYYWIYSRKLLEDLPVLHIKRRQFLRRINKYIELNLLTRKTIHALKSRRGSFTVYSLTEHFDALTHVGCVIDDTAGVSPMTQGVCHKRHTKDISTKDMPTKDSAHTRKTKSKTLKDKQKAFLDKLFDSEVMQ